MCGRYAIKTSAPELAAMFEVSAIPNDLEGTVSYNVAPTQAVPVCRVHPEGGRALEAMRWGLIPSWAKDAKSASRMINARCETVAEKPAFRTALRRRRCLVPASGFYEWRSEAGGKQPYYIELRSGALFAFAGLWEQWRSPEGRAVRSCTIVTTRANALLEPLHARMPVILPRAAYERWLDIRVERPADVERLLAPYSEVEMRAFAVDTLVNSPRNNEPSCRSPLAAPGSAP